MKTKRRRETADLMAHRARRPDASAIAACVSLVLALGIAGCLEPDTCEVDYTITSSWSGGFVAKIVVTNLQTATAVDGWTLRFPAPMPQTLDDVWNARAVAEGTEIALANLDYDARLGAGESVALGYQASSAHTPTIPVSFTLNGSACRTAGATTTTTPTAGASSTPTPAPTATPMPTASAAPTPAPTGAPSTSGVRVHFERTEDWGSGYTAEIRITNGGSSTISGWTLGFQLADRITNLWNGVLRIPATGDYLVDHASWNGILEPGASVVVGFNASVAMAGALPDGCRFNDESCDFAFDSPTPAGPGATPTPAGPTATPAATPTSPAAPTPTPPPAPTPTPPATASGKKIVGYFVSWGVYGRNYHVTDVPADELTHINYAFANVSSDGLCVLGDPYADVDQFYDGDSWDAGALRGNFNQLLKLKAAHPQLRTLISVGGWTWSGRFSDVALTAESRARFAESCVQFVVDYGFDGIDIDWEYPVGGGLGTNAARPEDEANYTLLLRELRDRLDALGSSDGREYLLTIAAPAGPSNYAHFELGAIAGIVDWINLMAYDFHGAWESTTGLHTALFPATDDPSPDPVAREQFNVDAAVTAYLAAGVPAAKLVVGMALYGRGWAGVPATHGGLFQPATGPAPGTWEPGNYDYADIQTNLLAAGYTRYWHPDALVPWAYSPSAGVMITYDDPESIARKAELVMARGLAGAMLWELSGDVRSGPDSLVQTVHAGLAGAAP